MVITLCRRNENSSTSINTSLSSSVKHCLPIYTKENKFDKKKKRHVWNKHTKKEWGGGIPSGIFKAKDAALRTNHNNCHVYLARFHLKVEVKVNLISLAWSLCSYSSFIYMMRGWNYKWIKRVRATRNSWGYFWQQGNIDEYKKEERLEKGNNIIRQQDIIGWIFTYHYLESSFTHAFLNLKGWNQK